MAEADLTPKFAPFLGMGGIAFAMIFGCKRRITAQSGQEHMLRVQQA